MRLLGRLLAHPLLGKALTLSGGTALAQLLSIAAMPLLSRLYTPADFAAAQMFLFFSSIALTVITLRYELAIPTPKGNREAGYLFLASQIAALLLVPLASWILSLMISENAFGFSNFPAWAPWLMLGYLWLAAIFFGFRYWLIRQGEFLLLAQVTAVRGGARALLQVGLGLWPAGPLGMLLGELGGQLAGIRRMLRQSLAQLAEGIRPFSMRVLTQQIRLHKGFPLYGLPSAFLDTVAQALPLFLMSTLYGPVVAGYFTLVQRVFAVPLSLIGQSIADSFHADLSKVYHADSTQLRRLFFNATRILASMAFTLGVVVALTSLWLFPLLFGEAWQPSGEMAFWMAPWFVAQLIVSPLSRLVFVQDGQRIKLVYDFTAVVAVLLAYALAQNFSLPPLGFLKCLVLCKTLTYAIYYVLLVRLLPPCAR